MKLEATDKILIIEMDWKDNPTKEQWKQLSDHLNSIPDGLLIELSVTTGDAKVFYCGPDGIQDWLGTRCAMEVFVDYSIDDEKGLDVEFYFKKGKLWVMVGDCIMLFEDWVTKVNEWHDKEDEEEPEVTKLLLIVMPGNGQQSHIEYVNVPSDEDIDDAINETIDEYAQGFQAAVILKPDMIEQLKTFLNDNV